MDIHELLANRPKGLQWDLKPKSLDRWNSGLKAAADTGNDIGIFDVIGEDYWGEGVTSKRISGALRSIGSENPVVVNINSPGGDMFEGITIYNLLKEHQGEVTVKVLGMAASAASVIAMAADRIEIARPAFFMIHNAWALSIGDRHEHRAFGDYLEPFDMAMADVYSARTGVETEELIEMMNRETWLGGQAAIDAGFADDLLASDQVSESESKDQKAAARKLDIALAKSGMPRSERRGLVKTLLTESKSSTQSAAGGDTPGAVTTNTPRAVVLEADPLPKLNFSLTD